MNKNDLALPDWLGSGEDLFGTIQIIQRKKIKEGFLEIDYNFKFSEEFNYPIVFKLKNIDDNLVADGLAFRISEEIAMAKKAIEENIIARQVCRMLRHADFVNFFAEVVKEDINFALYLNKTPEKFSGLKIYLLNDHQKIFFNQRLIIEIMAELDRQKAAQSLSLDIAESIIS